MQTKNEISFSKSMIFSIANISNIVGMYEHRKISYFLKSNDRVDQGTRFSIDRLPRVIRTSFDRAHYFSDIVDLNRAGLVSNWRIISPTFDIIISVRSW